MKRIDGKTLKEWIAEETEEQEQKGYAGDIIGTFKPVLFRPCKHSDFYGDQQQLVYFHTISQRSYHWVLLIDSNIDVKSDYFKDHQQEDLIRELEEEFGAWNDDIEAFESYDHYLEQDYPTVATDDGWGWGEIVNFGKISDRQFQDMLIRYAAANTKKGDGIVFANSLDVVETFAAELKMTKVKMKRQLERVLHKYETHRFTFHTVKRLGKGDARICPKNDKGEFIMVFSYSPALLLNL